MRLKALSRGGSPELSRIALDTTVGMIYSNLVTVVALLWSLVR